MVDGGFVLITVSGSIPLALYLKVPCTFPQLPVPIQVTFALTTNVLFWATLLLDNSGGVSKITDKYADGGGATNVVVVLVVDVDVVVLVDVV